MSIEPSQFFVRLPDPLQEQVISFLGARSRSRLFCVCKGLHALTERPYIQFLVLADKAIRERRAIECLLSMGKAKVVIHLTPFSISNIVCENGLNIDTASLRTFQRVIDEQYEKVTSACVYNLADQCLIVRKPKKPENTQSIKNQAFAFLLQKIKTSLKPLAEIVKAVENFDDVPPLTDFSLFQERFQRVRILADQNLLHSARFHAVSLKHEFEKSTAMRSVEEYNEYLHLQRFLAGLDIKLGNCCMAKAAKTAEIVLKLHDIYPRNVVTDI